LPQSQLKKARPIAGVQQDAFSKVQTIRDLVPLLLRDREARMSGARLTQPVLVRAGPGTGKSWSLQQLLYFLADALVSEKADRIHLVPLLLPIQKLARMLRQQSKGCSGEELDTNLVRFFINKDDNLSDQTRQMLLQALEMRTLVLLMDGVDEAANVKQAIEDFVTKQLLPLGIPLVLTSRPEGIRKRLYARDFVIMNLQPLTSEEQHQIAERQLRGDPLFEHLAVLNAARKSGQQASKEHRNFIKDRLEVATSGRDDEFEELLKERLVAFDEICGMPVLLSVLVCLLKGWWGKADELPKDKYELYQMGIWAKVAQDLKSSDSKYTIRGKSKDEARKQIGLAVEMLRLIGTANHLAKRRTFQLPDVHKALAGRADLEDVWAVLLAAGEVPLIRIVTLGEASGGEFQFCHLSFQEFLFVSTMCADCKTPHDFFAKEDELNAKLNDPFYRNAITIGSGHIGEALSKQRPDWSLDRYPRLSALGVDGLRHLLAGSVWLQSLDLSNVELDGPAMGRLVEALSLRGLPELRKLSLRFCKLPASSAGAVGRLLRICPVLEDLDLEWNRELLNSGQAAANLTDELGDEGLPCLRRLGLRWCHLPEVVKQPLGILRARCPKLEEVDLLGDRRIAEGSSFV